MERRVTDVMLLMMAVPDRLMVLDDLYESFLTTLDTAVVVVSPKPSLTAHDTADAVVVLGSMLTAEERQSPPRPTPPSSSLSPLPLFRESMMKMMTTARPTTMTPMDPRPLPSARPPTWPATSACSFRRGSGS